MKIKLNKKVKAILESNTGVNRSYDILKKWGLGTDSKYGRYSAKAIFGDNIEDLHDEYAEDAKAMIQEDGWSKPCPDIVWPMCPGLHNYVGKRYPINQWKYMLNQIFGIKSTDIDWKPIVKMYRRNLEIIFVFSPSIATMCTDGCTIAINPVFFQHLLDKCEEAGLKKASGVMFVIIHEIYHVLLQHVYRQNAGGFPPGEMTNVAADYEVNTSIVYDLGKESSISGKVENWDFNFIKNIINGYAKQDWHHKSFEEIYKLMEKDMESTPEEKWGPDTVEVIKEAIEAAKQEIREGLHG